MNIRVSSGRKGDTLLLYVIEVVVSHENKIAKVPEEKKDVFPSMAREVFSNEAFPVGLLYPKAYCVYCGVR